MTGKNENPTTAYVSYSIVNVGLEKEGEPNLWVSLITGASGEETPLSANYSDTDGRHVLDFTPAQFAEMLWREFTRRASDIKTTLRKVKDD